MNFKHLFRVPQTESMKAETRQFLPQWQQGLPLVVLAPTLVLRDVAGLIWASGREFGYLLQNEYCPIFQKPFDTIYSIGYWELNQVDSVNFRQTNSKPTNPLDTDNTSVHVAEDEKKCADNSSIKNDNNP